MFTLIGCLSAEGLLDDELLDSLSSSPLLLLLVLGAFGSQLSEDPLERSPEEEDDSSSSVSANDDSE
jgi:hypothetical protein